MSASKRGYTNQVNTGAVEFFSHNFKNFLQPYGKAYIQLNDRIIKHGLAYSTFSNSIIKKFKFSLRREWSKNVGKAEGLFGHIFWCEV